MDELPPGDELELRRLRKESAQAARNRKANETIRREWLRVKLGVPTDPDEEAWPPTAVVLAMIERLRDETGKEPGVDTLVKMLPGSNASTIRRRLGRLK